MRGSLYVVAGTFPLAFLALFANLLCLATFARLSKAAGKGELDLHIPSLDSLSLKPLMD